MLEPRTAKTCIFCKVQLSKANRTREHVIRQAWLKRLGFFETEIHAVGSTGSQVRSERRFQAQGFVAGEVCGDCNSGWMQRLDTEVEGVILLMAAGLMQPNEIPEKWRPVLARWALKTVCALEATDSPGHRHSTDEMRKGLLEGKLPEGSITLQACIRPNSTLGVSINDAWIGDWEVAEYLQNKPQSRRLKFGIGIGQVVFAGACLFDAEFVGFRTHPEWHQLVFQQRAKNMYDPYDQDYLFANLKWDPMQKQFPQSVSAAMLQIFAYKPRRPDASPDKAG